MIHRHAGHIGLAGHRLDGEAGIAIVGHQEVAGRRQDTGARLFGGGLAVPQAIRARDRTLDSSDNYIV